MNIYDSNSIIYGKENDILLCPLHILFNACIDTIADLRNNEIISIFYAANNGFINLKLCLIIIMMNSMDLCNLSHTIAPDLLFN